MELRIPLTGTVLHEGEYWGKGDLIGDNDDPIRSLPLNVRNLALKVLDIDLKNEEAIVELIPSEEISEPDLDENGVQKVDPVDGHLRFKKRLATEVEKSAWLEEARQMVEGHTKEELYAISGCHKLIRPKREVVK